MNDLDRRIKNTIEPDQKKDNQPEANIPEQNNSILGYHLIEIIKWEKGKC